MHVLESEYLFSIFGQVARHGDDVSNLAPVDFDYRQLVQVPIQVFDVNPLLGPRQHLDEVLPDLEPVLFIEFRVPKRELYSRLERFVEATHPVSREDEDAVVVLQYAEEDCTVSF